MRLREAVHHSRAYRVGVTLRRWTRNSVVVAFLLNERFQQTFIGMTLLVSIVSVHRSSMDASVKFLSFVALFAIVVALVWSLADPLAEEGTNTDRQ